MRVAVLSLALVLSACAAIKNPINYNELATIESAYGVALSAAVGYRNLPLCHTGTIATLQNVCAQRSIIVKLQQADLTAQKAILAANSFVEQNPTLDAAAVVAAAQQALAGFQSLLVTYGIK